MIEILKRLLPEGTVLTWESAETSRRSRRILKPEMLGMHVDSDGALVDEREEYGTSSSSSSHSSEDVNSDDVQENISDFEYLFKTIYITDVCIASSDKINVFHMVLNEKL